MAQCCWGRWKDRALAGGTAEEERSTRALECHSCYSVPPPPSLSLLQMQPSKEEEARPKETSDEGTGADGDNVLRMTPATPG